MGIVLKSRSLSLVEPSEPVQVCDGIALHFYPKVGYSVFLRNFGKVKVKQSRYRPGVAQRVPGS
jgi:hypothetical protein